MQNWNLTLHLQSTSLHCLSFSIEKRWEMNKYKVGKTSLTINIDLNFPRPMINRRCCHWHFAACVNELIKDLEKWQIDVWKDLQNEKDDRPRDESIKKKPLNWNVFSGHIFPTTICHKTLWERLHFLLLWSSLFFFFKKVFVPTCTCPNSPTVLKRSTNITYTNLIFKTIIILKRGDFQQISIHCHVILMFSIFSPNIVPISYTQ